MLIFCGQFGDVSYRYLATELDPSELHCFFGEAASASIAHVQHHRPPVCTRGMSERLWRKTWLEPGGSFDSSGLELKALKI